jgi:hypothetical protein
VLWLDEQHIFHVAQGDVITGSINFIRSTINRRDYHLRVTWGGADGGTVNSQLFKLES